jgi:hypothetical protein
MQRSLIQWVVYKTTEKQLSPRELLTARKIVYLALIILLLGFSFLWRTYVVDAKAAELALRETNRGEADLTGSALRLSLSGLRGMVTCYLWVSANDKQMKNQWNELELLVNSLTKLQPHFITPWLFQSWNLSYNVSVESDRVNDKYFYIARGIQLLAAGERQNQNQPDLRYWLGNMTQNKIGQSDETNYLRSLFQLSGIEPRERDPARFQKTVDGKQEIDWVAFEEFCKNHPQLCRRLHDGIRRETKREHDRQFTCETVDAVIQFLEDNKKVLSLYKEPDPTRPDELLPPSERFPVLPPPRNYPSGGVLQKYDESALTYDLPWLDEYDCNTAAHAWYSYAQEPLPGNSDLPGKPEPIKDPIRQRLPKNMTTQIFRNSPAQARRFTAERLQQEGWFLDEGWKITGWFDDNKEREVGGKGKKWSQEAWEAAALQWHRIGKNNLLLLEPEDEANLRSRAEKFFRDHPGLTPGSPLPPAREEDLKEEDRENYRAARYMFEYQFYRNVTNFPHHYFRSKVEALPETVKARRCFYDAVTLQLKGSPLRARKKYEEPSGLKAWRELLLKNKEFRRDSFIQEQTCEIQMRYQKLEAFSIATPGDQKEEETRAMHALDVVLMRIPLFPQCVVSPSTVSIWPRAESLNDPLLLLQRGPFDVVDDEGEPLIPEHVRASVLQRLMPPAGASPPPRQPTQGPAPKPQP